MQSRLLHNRWFGKFIGVMAAWLLTPTDPLYLPSAIIAGIAVGHAFDYWAWYEAGSPRRQLPYLDQRGLAHAAPHLRFMYAAFGAIAKSGGLVSATHVRYADALMSNMGFNASSKSQAIEWFDAGKRGAFDFESAARECLTGAPAAEQLRATTLSCMCDITAIRASNAAITELKRHAATLGFAPARAIAELDQALQHLKSQGRAHPQDADVEDTHAIPTEVSAAYHCLDVRPGANFASAKRAYRRMVSRYHPDRLPNNATITQNEYANARMVEFREAIETIEAHAHAPTNNGLHPDD